MIIGKGSGDENIHYGPAVIEFAGAGLALAGGIEAFKRGNIKTGVVCVGAAALWATGGVILSSPESRIARRASGTLGIDPQVVDQVRHSGLMATAITLATGMRPNLNPTATPPLHPPSYGVPIFRQHEIRPDSGPSQPAASNIFSHPTPPIRTEEVGPPTHY